MSKNNDRELGHGAEADGIEEYDNPLPDWYIGLFIVTIVWAVVYTVQWHVLDSKSQAAMYQQELADARAQWPDLEKKVNQDMSAETLALGAETFASTCVACHGAELQGGIGANLVDTTWIHGGNYEDIVKTITEGVGPKGMPQWGPILGPKKIAALASFILSKNTGQPGPDAATPPPEAPPAAPTDAPAPAPADGAAPAPAEAPAPTP